MTKAFFVYLTSYILLYQACRHPDLTSQAPISDSSFSLGEFGYDLHFLKKWDSTLVVLKDGDAKLIVSPKYQGKVFTSTATGDRGLSFGWINYKVFGNGSDDHMHAYGGENRLWLGPEGGKYSLFFKPDSVMIYDNWRTPPAFDTEGWNLSQRDSNKITLSKDMNLTNYSGNRLSLRVDRGIKILNHQDIENCFGFHNNDSLRIVGYETENLLTNTGEQAWTVTNGMPCIWILDMFKPSSRTLIILPFEYARGENFDQVATTNYFGQIPPERLKHNDSMLFLRADGNSRGKLGIQPKKAKPLAGSYDPENSVLTIILFDLERTSRYLNQEWNIEKPPFSGDAVNAYNDGPLTNGTQMGPFYEMESVSPAAFLKSKETLLHKHSVFHFSGSAVELNKVAVKLLGISLDSLQKIFTDGEKP